MELRDQVEPEEVQKCWILHEQKSREGKIGIKAQAFLVKGDYTNALYAYRGDYPKDVFKHLKHWHSAQLDYNDIATLKHVSCELDNLSNGSRVIGEAAENLINNPNLSDPQHNPGSFWHVKDIFDRLKELAMDDTPVVAGEDYARNYEPIIFDGFHRLVASIIYSKKKGKPLKEKIAYFGLR